MSKRLLVMAGGTGGHIFPGLAVADELHNQGWHIHWLGTKQRMEADIVPKAGYDISFIDVSGVRGNGLLRLLAAPFQIIKSILQARKVIKEFVPDLVLGMGGFASGPGGVAAWINGKPLLLHEQNAAPGLTNRLLAHIAQKVLTGFDKTFSNQNESDDKFIWVGNPVRTTFYEINKSEAGVCFPINILVVGGSLGASALNEYVPKTMEGIDKESYKIRHQCGAGKQSEIEANYQNIDAANWTVDDFIDDMASAYQWADVVICRAGALTVSEVAAAGVAAIFVPLPHAVDDHQTKNAQSLTEANAALLITQEQLKQGELKRQLETLIDEPEKIRRMGTNARQSAKLDALNAVVENCKLLVGNKK